MFHSAAHQQPNPYDLHSMWPAQYTQAVVRSSQPPVGLGGFCPKKAPLCYAAMPEGSSIMLNLEAYYAQNMPTVCPQGLL